jgi:ribosomal protein S18 acetylase RimI-like enzyme
MAITGADGAGAGPLGVTVQPDLALVRRLEALGLRAWPAVNTCIEGTWMVRLTPGHPSWRLNSVNPLDPGDIVDFEQRIGLVTPRFHDAGREVVFRLSPLAPRTLENHLDATGWVPRKASLVMVRRELRSADIDAAITQIPLRDAARFADASAHIHGYGEAVTRGLEKVIEAIGPEAGLFLLEVDQQPLCSAICVCDGQYAGLFEVATHPSVQGKGYGRRIVLSALKWARLRGASVGWLQVQADNAPALALYRALGFEPAYDYHYRVKAS